MVVGINRAQLEVTVRKLMYYYILGYGDMAD